LLVLWLAAAVAGLGYYVTHTRQFSPQQIAEDLRSCEGLMLVVYLMASVSRAFVLIPSTPFVLAGCLLFPGRPAVVLGISLLGIAISASLIYFCAEGLGLDAHFRRRHSTRFARLESALKGRWGFWVLAGWAFFPLVPTDVACYVAGTVRVPFWRFLAAVCFGELIVCAFYVFSSQAAWQGFFAS
jgi:uncharacterized membrane protein YdjX (TVP38/TMEM64 family)